MRAEPATQEAAIAATTERRSGLAQALTAARPRYCMRCGAEVGIGQAFCGDCGARLTDVASRAGGPAASPMPSDERKHVSILFADIVGSTALVSGLDPEQSATVLDPVLSDMAAIVARHGGFISGLRGDGVKAVFGVPHTREDHAERACAAALAIRAAARSRRVHARVGIHSGDVLVRRLASDAYNEYDAVGPAVHLAARMEQGAQPGTIQLSAATANLVAGRFSLRPLGSQAAKGITAAVPVFELRSRTRRTRWSARSRQQLATFVGRGGELSRLLGLIGQAAPVIGVVGEAGAGKSRLLHELMRRSELAHWTVLRAEVEPDDARAGLWPFAQMLRTWLKTSRDDPPAHIRACLDARLAGLDASDPDIAIRQADLAALHELLDVSEPPRQSRLAASQIARALQRLVSGCAECQRILLVVEDVHWLNGDGFDFLRWLCQAAASGRVAIILTSRPPLNPALLTTHTVALAPLTAVEAMGMLDARMGESSTLSALKTRIIERAGGIPLFIEELAKLASETEQRESAIPDTIHAVIGERIDRLPAVCRDLLRIAAVIGHEIPLPVLSQVVSYSRYEVLSGLRLLQEAGFVRAVSHDTDTRLSLNHALTREVAFAGLLKAERARIHRAVLAAYETLDAAGLDALAGELGMHALEGELWLKAEAYLRRAAQKAIDRASHVSAIRFANDALRALSRANLPPRETAARELDLRLLLRTGYNAVGNYRERLTNLNRAERLAQAAARDETLPTLWISRAHTLLQLGRTDAALALCRRAEKVAASKQDYDVQVGVGYTLTRIYLYVGRLHASLATAERTLALLRERPGYERHGGGFGSTMVMLLTQLAHVQACLGQLAPARASVAAALQAADRSQRPFDVMLAGYASGVAGLYGGELAAAIPDLESGLAASTTESAQSTHVAVASLLAYAYLRAGRGVEALALARRALSAAETSLYHANWPRLFGGVVLHANGCADEARGLMASARAAARKGNYRVQRVWCDLVAAQLGAATNAAAALRHLRQARVESERIGLRPCLTWALIETARLRQIAGADDDAARLRRRATRLSQTMAPRWRGMSDPGVTAGESP